MCEHCEPVLTMNGWICPDCGQTFETKPPRVGKITFLNVEEPKEEIPVEEVEEVKEEPKPKKRNSKSATAKKG